MHRATRIHPALSLLLAALVFTAGGARAGTHVVLKVRNNGSLFSLFSGNKTMSAVLCSEQGDTALTEEKLAHSKFCAFLLIAGEGLKFDKDWLDENLQGVFLTQNGIRYNVLFRDSLHTGNSHSTIVVGFDKAVRLSTPFTITSSIGDEHDEQPVTVPMEVWPGHTVVTREVAAGNDALRGGKYDEAIASCNRVLADTALVIFPDYAEARRRRLTALSTTFLDHQQEIVHALVADTTQLKQKIRLVETHLVGLRYVADTTTTIPRTVADSATNALQADAVARLRITERRLDSLRAAYDDENVRWILVGASRGSPDPRYAQMIDALTRAYLGSDFSDPATPEVRITIPERAAATLRRYNLRESFDTFVRLSNAARAKHQPMFSNEFLTNIAADSLPLPYHQTLRAVNDFFRGNPAEALLQVGESLKKSYDESFNLQLDQFRVQILALRTAVKADIIDKMKEGRAAESAGDMNTALDRYKYILDILPSYVPAELAIALIHERGGESLRAANFLRRAVTQDPQSFAAIQHLVSSQEAAENYEDLYKTISTAMQKDNDTYYIHHYAGRTLRRLGKNREAFAQAERALSCNPRGASALVVAAYALAGLNDYTRALEYISRAGELAPDDDEVIECQRELSQRGKKKDGEIRKKEADPQDKEQESPKKEPDQPPKEP